MHVITQYFLSRPENNLQLICQGGFILFLFIYLPHTIKYIINKNAKDYNK